MASGGRLDRSFFERQTVDVAREMIGALLVTRFGDVETAGRIVEVEAYGGADDPASHAARLKNGSVQSMAGPVGVAYVYQCYGLHAMLNVVAKAPGGTGAVLVRALEPLRGIEQMRARRGIEPARLLCSGPGRLCVAMGVGLEHHGIDCLSDERLSLLEGAPPATVWSGGRVGISKGRESAWRFFDPSSPYVSAHRQGSLATR